MSQGLRLKFNRERASTLCKQRSYRKLNNYITIFYHVDFASLADAKRTAENSPHNVAGLCLHVCLLEEQEKIIAHDHEEASGSQEDSGAEITVIASGIPPSSSEDSVRYYFENSRRSGGGDVCDIDFSHDGKAVITFTAVEGMNNYCSHKQSRIDDIISI